MKNKFLQIVTYSVILGLLFISVQSCAVSRMTEDMTFNPNTTKNGLIFGSITFPKERAKYNGYFLDVKFKSNDKSLRKENSTEIHFSPEQIFKMKHIGELDNGLTYLFAIERPEGDYQISGIRLFTNSGIAALQRNDFIYGFSIPFKVKSGEIMYVGNICFNEYGGLDKSTITYNNNFRKDLEGMKIAQKYIYWEAAKNDTLRKIEYR